jgi:Tfp pilus assembly protein PilN
MAARRPHIDLLSREDFSQRALGRLLLWILTVGRYIVIFTELIVIAGFITRVVLDRNLNSVNETLAEQKAILASYQPVEQRFRRVHQQVDSYSRIDEERLDISKLLEDLTGITPTEVRFESMNIDKNENAMDIVAIALSPGGFATFLSQLQSSVHFNNLILNYVETGGPQDPSINFSLTLELSGAQVPEAKSEAKVSLGTYP